MGEEGAEVRGERGGEGRKRGGEERERERRDRKNRAARRCREEGVGNDGERAGRPPACRSQQKRRGSIAGSLSPSSPTPGTTTG